MLCGELGDYVHVFKSSDVASDGIVGNNFAQQAAHDFTAAGFGKGVGEADLLGPREGSDFVGHPLAQFFAQLFVAKIALLQRDEAADGLTGDLMRLADYSGFGDWDGEPARTRLPWC